MAIVVSLVVGLTLFHTQVLAAPVTWISSNTLHTIVRPDSKPPAIVPSASFLPDIALTKKDLLAYKKEKRKKQPSDNKKPARYVSLTFDDGPSPFTPKILEILNAYNIRATFFVLGEQAKNNPEMIKIMHDAGHLIANHTWNHPDLTKLSTEDVKREINDSNSVIEELTGHRPRLFRPPYGKTNADVRSSIESTGMTSVLWNVDPADWNLKNSRPVHARVEEGLLEKSMILLHDGGGPRDKTVDSLPAIIEHLQAQGYEFVTATEYLDLQNKSL